ncbi:MAG: hypothetical protein V7L23_15115 [Nostoc sp.]|uniref:hypothetical protein n=1 Tax=Nostoc sp. TaxID=1180 RepID=UPI002FEFD631
MSIGFEMRLPCLEIRIDDSYYLMPDGSQIGIRSILNDFFKEIEQAQKFDQPVFKQILFPNHTYLKIHNAQVEFKVKSLELQGIIKTHTELVEIKENYIWLIMKSIFEKKMFIVYPDGTMREVLYE